MDRRTVYFVLVTLYTRVRLLVLIRPSANNLSGLVATKCQRDIGEGFLPTVFLKIQEILKYSHEM
jgi:hypothetical protein